MLEDCRGDAPCEINEDVTGARAGTAVAWVACDITTSEGRAAALAKCPQPDILVNPAGGPPPGNFRDWDREAWLATMRASIESALWQFSTARMVSEYVDRLYLPAVREPVRA